MQKKKFTFQDFKDCYPSKYIIKKKEEFFIPINYQTTTSENLLL